MGTLRLKTFYELEIEYGSIFVSDILEQYPSIINCLGESVKYSNNLGLETKQIHISLITAEPLIPIDSKVSIQLNKSVGVQKEKSGSYIRCLNSDQDFIYYLGFNKEGVYHILSNSRRGEITDWYTSNDILEAYYNFNHVENMPLFKLLKSYKN